jgi:hypothetical protein
MGDHISTVSTSTLNAQSPGFLKLPGELRNTIYRLVLITGQPVNLNQFLYNNNNSTTFKSEYGLLQVCSEIRAEASSIFWEENIFTFNTFNVLFLGPDLLDNLSHIGMIGDLLQSSGSRYTGKVPHLRLEHHGRSSDVELLVEHLDYFGVRAAVFYVSYSPASSKSGALV